MIKIVPGKEAGYKSDRAVIQITHSFTDNQLRDMVKAAVQALGLEEVKSILGLRRPNQNAPVKEYAAFEYYTNKLVGQGFDKKLLISLMERHANSSGNAVSVVQLVAKITVKDAEVKRSIHTTIMD